VDNLLRTSYPSYGYMFNNANEPATTLWELPDGACDGAVWCGRGGAPTTDDASK
jgi:hypothetical protein